MTKVFSPNIVLNEKLNMNLLEGYSSVHERNFINAVNFISDIKKNHLSNNRKFYKGIVEGTDYIDSHEAFLELFNNCIPNVEAIKNFFDNATSDFLSKLSILGDRNKELVSKKNILDDYFDDRDHLFVKKVYFYTIDDKIPNYSYLKSIISRVSSVILSKTEVTGNNKSEFLTDMIKNDKDTLGSVLRDCDFLNSFRGAVLDKADNISINNFESVAFSTFRNDATQKEDSTVGYETIKTCYENLANINKYTKLIETEKSELVSSYATLYAELLKFNKISADGKCVTMFDKNLVNLDEDIVREMDIYVKAIHNLVIEISSIYMMAFSVKLDAIIENYNQNADILYSAMCKVEGKESAIKIADTTMDDSIIRESSYRMLVLKEEEFQERLKYIITESNVFINDKYSDKIQMLYTIKEASDDGIKGRWNKLMEFLNKMWGKFVENMNRLFNSDQKYLQKYKDTIVGKKLKPVKITMKNYPEGIKRIVSKNIDLQIETKLADDGFDMKTSLIAEYDGKVQFNEFCKMYFQGGEQEQEFTETQLNMTDIYNFCHDRDKIMKAIEDDKKTIEQLKVKFEKMTLEMQSQVNDYKSNAEKEKAELEQDKKEADEAKKAPTQNQTSQPVQKDPPPVNNASPKVQGKPARTGVHGNAKPARTGVKSESAYSLLFEGYVNEMEINKTGAQDSSGTDNNKAVYNVKKTETSPDGTNQRHSDINFDYNKRVEKVTEVFTDCNTFITSKMTAINAIYVAYMRIIRSHVDDYVGTTNPSDDRAASPGTNYQS